MSPEDHEVWLVFRDEATEQLEELAHVADRLSDANSLSDKPALDQARRILHNIKGAARIANSQGIEMVAHALEEAFDPRQPDVPVSFVISQLRDGMGLISRFLGGDSPNEAAVAFVTRLQPNDAPHETSGRQSNPVPPDPSSRRAAGGGATIVRVEASRLDALMQFAEEFLVAQGRRKVWQAELDHCVTGLVQLERSVPDEVRPELADIARRLGVLVEAKRRDFQRMDHLVLDWSAAVKRARMLPLVGVIAQWRRTVAETAHALGREVRLVVDVGDIEVDRQILDALRDPMMHLLRNAVDHGIEAPEDRERQGKPRAGTIHVRARAPGMMVELDVSDDGRGLDVARIGRLAVERNVISADRLARMHDGEIAEVIFQAGFSTASSVSHLSGRGVGLDSVKQRISDLGGHIRIDAPLFGGTTFRIEVPATVVSTKALLVRTARSSYALPTAYVTRAFRAASSDVRMVDGGAAVADAEGEPLPLRWLSALMQEPRQTDHANLLIVAISDGTARLGLVVDEVVGEAEYVAKGLPWNIPRIAGIAGAMLLGTGALAIVVDVPRLLEVARGRQGDHTETVHTANAAKKLRVLVADDSLTSRTLARNILDAAGYEVETASDGELAWQALQAGPFDLVVTDVQMPRLDGFALTQRIRAHAKLKALPVILVTSLDRPADVTRGSAVGANEYIVKGRFDQRKLLEAVARLI